VSPRPTDRSPREPSARPGRRARALAWVRRRDDLGGLAAGAAEAVARLLAPERPALAPVRSAGRAPHGGGR
jgi:hypothetical protein